MNYRNLALATLLSSAMVWAVVAFQAPNAVYAQGNQGPNTIVDSSTSTNTLQNSPLWS